VEGGARGIREDGEGDDADGEEGRGAAGDSAQHLAAEPADGDADDGTPRELQGGEHIGQPVGHDEAVEADSMPECSDENP